METKHTGKKPPGRPLGSRDSRPRKQVRRDRVGSASGSGSGDSGILQRSPTLGEYKTGFVEGEYQDGGVRGIVFIAGIRNSGKSYHAARMVGRARRALVWDPTGSMRKYLKWPVFSSIEALKQQLAITYPDKPMQVIYRPQGGDMAEHFETVAWLAMEAKNMVLVVDEIDQLCSAGSSKAPDSEYWKTKKGGRPSAIYELVNYGRHKPVALVGMARFPASVWRGVTSQAREVIVFATNEPNEIDYWTGKLGPAGEQLSKLPKYEFIRKIEGEGPCTVSGGAEKIA